MPDKLPSKHENMVIKIVACVSLKGSYLLVWRKNLIIQHHLKSVSYCNWINSKPDDLDNNKYTHCKVFFPTVHAPELIGVPRNQSADIGANVTFNCTATGLTTPSISWIKNNDSFALQSNPRVTFINDPLDDKSTQSHLFITRVKEEDFGKYQCEAKNSGDKNLSLPAFLTPKVSG